MTDTLHEAVGALRHAAAVLAAERPTVRARVEAELPDTPGVRFKSLADGRVRTRSELVANIGVAATAPMWDDSVRYGDDFPTFSRGAPTVVIGRPFGDLPARGWVGPESLSQHGIPADQPEGEPLYSNALHVVTSDDSWAPTEDHLRVHKVAVLVDPEVPPTIDGTQALVVAAVVCREASERLSTWSTGRADQARRFTAEAAVLGRHADACVAALPAALAWVEDFHAEHPTPNPNGRPRSFPTVPTELRGTTEFRHHNPQVKGPNQCLY